MHDAEVILRAPDLGRRYGGIMRIGRSIIIPAILALSAAGSILVGSTAPATVAQGTTAHVVTMTHATWYHG